MFASTSAATKLPLLAAKLSAEDVSVMMISVGVCRIGVSLAATRFTTKSTLVVATPSNTPNSNVSKVFAVKALIAASFGVNVYAPVEVVNTSVP